jgi:hypothetical protein
MTTIKAIETKYKGYRFRSRLEARWAVFFDAMEIKWEYEKEGYDLGEVGWYLPDFWLSNYSWAEIKPKSILQDAFWKTIDQCSALAFQSNHPVALISGDPWPNEYTIMYFPHD